MNLCSNDYLGNPYNKNLNEINYNLVPDWFLEMMNHIKNLEEVSSKTQISSK